MLEMPVARFPFQNMFEFWGEDTVPNCRSHDSEFAAFQEIQKLSGLLAGRRMDLLFDDSGQDTRGRRIVSNMAEQEFGE